MEYYTEAEIEKILKRSAKILGIDSKDGALKEISIRSRFTPRTANYLLKRARDFAQVKKSALSKESVVDALKLLGVDELGLHPSDRSLLTVLIEKFGGGPVGVRLAAAVLRRKHTSISKASARR